MFACDIAGGWEALLKPKPGLNGSLVVSARDSSFYTLSDPRNPLAA